MRENAVLKTARGALRAVLALVTALAFTKTCLADAEPITAINPVTGEAEEYVQKYVGDGGWTADDFVYGDGSKPSAAPAIRDSGNYESILIDGDVTLEPEGQFEGWALNLGLFNGAKLTIADLFKWQGGCNVRVDANSKLTVNALGDGSFGNNLFYYVTAPAGVEYKCSFGTYDMALYSLYHLAGEGYIAYDAITAGYHVIKEADVTLTGGEKAVRSKTLVTFTSCEIDFTADADIAVKDGDDVLRYVGAKSFTHGATTLTTNDKVGECELVQTDTGVYLYYVDGDPDAVSYTPSININFIDRNALETKADVGLAGYAVPGPSWDNMVGANGTLDEVHVTDATGAASVLPGASVTVSNSRGSWWCLYLSGGSNLLGGYVDDNETLSTPTVTVSGIPFEKYRVIVYHSTDTANAKFGYDTINGENYTYVNGVLTFGDSAWGNAGPDNSANPVEEGVNALVTGILSNETVTVVGHREWAEKGSRGCIAAIQIVEVSMGANDVVINVDGDTTYTVESDADVGTVYLDGIGTLTLEGEGKISADVLDIGSGVTLKMNADRLDAATVTGSGVALYDGVVPQRDKGWTEDTWRGTVWLRNFTITGNDNATTGVMPNTIGHKGSKVMLSGVSGWLEAPVEYKPEIVLENDGFDYALQLTNGNSPNLGNPNRVTVIRTLSGSGTLCRANINNNGAWPTLKVYDASRFTGSITTLESPSYAGSLVLFCKEDTVFDDTILATFSSYNRTIYVAPGCEVTVAEGATWTAHSGFIVEGKLKVEGSIASSHTTKAISGSGEVVFTGRAPTVSGDAWWKNEAWTGLVRVKEVYNLVGTSDSSGSYIDFNECGNENSVIELCNVRGWINPSYSCTVPLKIAGTLTLENGYSNQDWAFRVGTLLGDGNISAPSLSPAPTVVFNVTDDWSGFTGRLSLGNKCVVFGKTLPESLTLGTIYISEGAVVEKYNGSIWWAEGGMRVDGEFRAANLNSIGDGTSITLGDNGVVTLTNTDNISDTTVDYGRIGGTGTLKLVSESNWRTLSTNNLSTAITLQNEVGDGLLLQLNNYTYEIGSLAGSKGIRTDWKNGNRHLRIHQSKNTEWSGTFFLTDRIGTVYVTGGEERSGTLTLSGEQDEDQNNGLVVEAGGSVNLTGVWFGNASVGGTFGGTGTLNGDLAFGDGATFKVFAADDDGFAVSGAVACDGSVTVDVSAIDAEEDVVLITAGELDAEGFSLADGTPETYSLVAESGKLVLKWTEPPAPVTDVVWSINENGVLNGVTLNGNTEIVIPEEATSISPTVFSGRVGLVSVTIHGGVTNIGLGAFAECSSLTNIVFEGNAPEMGEYVFTNVCAECVVHVHYGSTGWGVDIPGVWNGVAIEYIPCLHDGTFTMVGVVAATCKETGYTGDRVCDICGETVAEGEVIPVADHMLVWHDGQEATCTEDGFDCMWVCSLCGEVIEVVNPMPALGHESDEGEVTKSATHYEEGEKEYHCVRCGILLETETIPCLEDDVIVVSPTLEGVDFKTADDGKFELWLEEFIFSSSTPTITVKGLPAGLKYDAKTLAIGGKATKPGTYPVTISVTNAKVKTPVTATFNIEVPNFKDEEIEIEDSYGPYIPGVSYVVDLKDAEGCAVSGLPSGFKYDAKTLTVSGAPTKPGSYTVTFTKTVNKEKHTATATFTVSELPVVTVGTEGSGSGKVTGAKAYLANAKVTLKATPDKGSVFIGWSNGGFLISRAESYTFVMPETDTTLTANFVSAAEDASAATATVDGLAFDAANLTSETNITAGVYLEWPVEVKGTLTALASVKVTGLPSGLKFADKDVVDSKTKQILVHANTIYGTPTAASKTDKTGVVVPSVVKVTATTTGKTTIVYSIAVTVDPLPAWVSGTFNGGSYEGQSTLTITAAGKITGKHLEKGLTWTLSAANFSACDGEGCLATVSAKSGKIEHSMILELVPDDDLVSVATLTEEYAVEDPISDIDLYRTDWKNEPWKTIAKPFNGKTLKLGDITLKFASSGAVTATGTFVTGVDAKGKNIIYSASCAATLIPQGDDYYCVYIYFPPKAGKFEGYSNLIDLSWNGDAFEVAPIE